MADLQRKRYLAQLIKKHQHWNANTNFFYKYLYLSRHCPFVQLVIVYYVKTLLKKTLSYTKMLQNPNDLQ